MSAGAAVAPADSGASASTAEPLVRTRGLTKRYDDLVAVDRLDLEVRPGEIFGLLGQNGAGKTTTILMLLGLTEPTSGEARVVGLDPARNPLEVKRRVGYLPDAVGFYGDLTGRENLRYTARLNGIRRAEAEARMDEVLAQVDLTDRADTRTDTYSRGMLQRLGIADALVKDPALLILDEPTTAIDPIGVVEILDLLRGLVRDRGLAVLLSSHLLGQVQSVCDRIGIFAAGRLIGRGSLDQLARQFGEEAAELTVGVEAERSTDPATIESRLRAIDGVAGVTRVSTTQDNEWTWHIRVKAGAAEPVVRGGILRMLTDGGLRLADLSRQPPSLEDIYRRAVQRARLDRAGREGPRASGGSAAPRPAPRPAPAAEPAARKPAGMPSRVRSRRRPQQGPGPGPEAPP
ncbi:MAG TPA: ABC transporter ATP-binding protein [Candidatus Limnocylindria bacterium]|nr:ABC transporter ATP-binding protein [Candidatus Limnocylindria bacterium]